MLTRISVAWLALAACLLPGQAIFAQEPEITFTQTPTGPGVTGENNEFYIAGQQIQFRMDLKSAEGADPLVSFFETQVPTGWRFVGVLGADSPDVIPLQTGGLLTFAWLGRLALPATFFVVMEVPADENTARTISSRVRYRDASGTAVLSPQVSSVMRKDTVRPSIALIGGGITLNCQQSFADPGVTATDNADGDVTANVVRSGDIVNPNAPGRYEIIYNVTDRSGNASTTVRRFVAVLNNCPTTDPGLCEGGCTDDDGTDTDGDGLTDCEEECIYGTELNDPDSDGDGMGDSYEVQYLPTLDPNDPSDRNEDSDGDSFSNFEEFLRGGSPVDTSSPARAYFVGPGGVNNFRLGTRDQPFRTIAFAMNIAAASATPARRSTVILLEGVYNENVNLRPFVTLRGEGNVVLQGLVNGSDDARIERLVLNGVTDDDVLLDLRGGGLGTTTRVQNVVFQNAAIGILSGGAKSADAVVDACTFQSLEVGIEVLDAAPTLRRSLFRDIAARAKGAQSAGIIVRDPGKQAEEVEDEGNLGDAADPGAGFNTFVLGTFEGPAVINERPNVVKAEENDWNTDDGEAIAAALDGPVDFDPFLKAGQALLASSLFCTVVDSADQSRVEDATVALAPGGYATQTENEDGVYTFAALPDGNYTVTVDAPGFDQKTVNVVIAPGELANVLVTLGETPPPPGCNQGGEQAEASLASSPGNVTIAVLLLVALLSATALVSRRESASVHRSK